MYVVSGHEPDEVGPPIEIDIGAEIVNNVTNELVKAAALVHGVDPLSASVMGGGVGGLAKSLVSAAQRAYERRRARLTIALEAAYEESGHGPGELLAEALGDDRKLELLTRAFEAAQRDADLRRVRFYGRIAAAGVMAQDDAKVNATERIFRTIASLDAADLKVLLYMASKGKAIWSVFELPTDRVRTLSAELPEVNVMLEPIVYRLLGLGLLTDKDGDTSYADAYLVSPFARLCVESLLNDSLVDLPDANYDPAAAPIQSQQHT
jgi:hypothetical protein